MKPMALLALAAASCMLSGCVFWDIRNEVRNTNARLDQVDCQLQATNENLEKTNEQLGVVKTELQMLQATNVSLADMQQRLALLKSIDTTLVALEAHLAGLRKVIARIDGIIPFFDLGADMPAESPARPEPVAEADKPVPTVAEAGKGAGKEAGKEGVKEEAAAAPARKDSLLGTWISAYPDRATALVLQDKGRYAMYTAAQQNKPAASEVGGWKREGDRLTLTPDARPPTKERSKEPASGPSVLEIVGQTTRSLTVKTKDGGLQVFGKP